LAGEILKKRREELGIDIREASDALKISSECLSAIENDIFDKLPVAVYTIGYIRCYAKYLDVDAEPVIANFVSHLTTPQPSTVIPVSSFKRKVPLYFYLIFAFVAGALTFVVYTFTVKNQTDGTTAEKAAPAVEEEIPPVPSAPPTSAVAPVTEPGETKTEEIKTSEPVPAAQDKKAHQVVITASDTVWLQIRFEDGKTEEVLLRSGDSKRWEFDGTAVLKIGNAGGVSLKFDGKDLGVPGNAGQVLNLTFPQG
jgi:cytoskeleton protein RodZ